MVNSLDKLVRLGGASLSSTVADSKALAKVYGEEVACLGRILRAKNGFYAFEGALHVLSDSGASREQGVMEWNAQELWRSDYEGMADNALFFAEDIFGVQFCLRNNSICTFDPETASFKHMAANLDEWSSIILNDYEFWTGYPIAHDWQVIHGPIPVGSRLLPIIPFVLGGEFTVSNMHILDAVQGMKLRASIAVQIRDLPDGATVELQIVKSKDSA